MLPNYSPQEILRIAVQVEEAGEKLYAKLEYEAKDVAITKIWNYLREQEHLHRDAFQKMLDNVGDYIVDNLNPGEYDKYIKAIASEYVFTPDAIEKKIQEGFSNDFAAIKFAIGMEKESILVYEAIKEYVSLNRQEALDKIINEEKKHLADLIVLKASLKREKED
jgi:rubrerythrin